MKYDIVIHRKFSSAITIDYGIIEGSSRILFIKAGQDGSMYGYENKYLRIAKRIREKYGVSVIVSSNPFDGRNPLDDAMAVIDDYCKRFDDYEIYYMGHSNGALIGATFGYRYPKIKRMMLVNMPLWHSRDYTYSCLSKFTGERVSIVYGDRDMSYPYVDMIRFWEDDRVKIYTVEDEDHHFTKDMEDFLSLPEKYLF